MLHWLEIVLPVVHVLGIITACDALMWARSPQSAIAWSVSLVTFPFVTLPFYWVFARSHFKGYRRLVSEFAKLHDDQLKGGRAIYNESISELLPIPDETRTALQRVAQRNFCSGNKVDLLINGEVTFLELLTAIERARSYILLQMYTIGNDGVGEKFREVLSKRSREGISVYVLYDEIGSSSLPSSYISEMEEAGVKIVPFSTRQGRGNFFQLNFRNHRKILIVDGKMGFLGGLNLADEYLGRSSLGNWRDTHIRVVGPAVLPMQESFLFDWSWATREPLQLKWDEASPEGDEHCLVMSYGPSDTKERGILFFLEAIRSAKERFWLATPYFVPDEAVIQELRLAALRGVDVRLLLPDTYDYFLVGMASYYYVPLVCQYGVKVYRYTHGFLHQKVFLIDDHLASVGTANLDNRSLRLNFEMMLVVVSQVFNSKVSEMFEKDLEDAFEESVSKYEKFPLPRRLGANIARLFSPVL